MAHHRDAARSIGGWRLIRLTLMLAPVLTLGGCGLFAAPCRVASAGLKIVPVVGHVAAAPTDACANAIDP